MVKTLFRKIGFSVIILVLVPNFVLAVDPPPPGGGTNPPAEAGFKSQCAQASKLQFPECANSPSECGSGSADLKYRTPFNCLFLGEPIGGKPGYDLYKITTIKTADGDQSNYQLWYGEAVLTEAGEVGPVQAVLAYEAGKESQGPFGLLYNYLGLVYNWLSGIIIAFVILIAIVGGIRMTVSGGNQQEFEAGKKMIIKSLVGMAIWFTASVILYTINPTFFAF